MQEIHVAVNRRLSSRLGRPGTPETERPFLPAEALPLGQSLAAFTAGVAYVNHREHELGSLRPGHQADIAVLSQDIFAVPPTEIGHTQVDLTIAAAQSGTEAPTAPARLPGAAPQPARKHHNLKKTLQLQKVPPTGSDSLITNMPY